jgi:type II secretory pathway component PulK
MKRNERGFAILTVMIFTAVAFMMLAVALTYACQWHRHNAWRQARLQNKAEAVTVVMPQVVP